MKDLPNLPRRNNQREAKFGVAFRKWLEKNPRMSSTFEMKDSRGRSSLPFSEVKEAQRKFGMAVKTREEGVLVRLVPLVEGTPDYGYFRKAPALVVIKYPKCFCLIDIETFILESKRSKVRSLTVSRAKDIALLTVMS